MQTDKVRILFLASNPSDTSRLSLDEEARAIEDRLHSTGSGDEFELITKWAVRATDIVASFNRHRPHVVHFSGHGMPNKGIVVVDTNERAKPLDIEALGELFRMFATDLKLVVLNACFSQAQAQVIADTVGCAIGLTSEIADRHAREFAAAFYQAIGFGHTVQGAFNQGKVLLRLEHGCCEFDLHLVAGKDIDTSRIVLKPIRGEKTEQINQQDAFAVDIRAAVKTWLEINANSLLSSGHGYLSVEEVSDPDSFVFVTPDGFTFVAIICQATSLSQVYHCIATAKARGIQARENSYSSSPKTPGMLFVIIARNSEDVTTLIREGKDLLESLLSGFLHGFGVIGFFGLDNQYHHVLLLGNYG